MSFGRAQEKRSTESADALPSSSPTPRRSDAAIMADELTRLAEQINLLKLTFHEDDFLTEKGKGISQKKLPRRRFSDGKGKRDFSEETST